MGQTTIGILYGVKAHDGLVLYSEDGDSGLIERWQHECSALIKAHQAKVDAKVVSTPGMMPWMLERGEARYVPDCEWESNPPLFGFWVAAGASGKNGLPNLNYLSVPLADLRTTEPYARAYRNARRRWARFARWARAQGVDLPEARLWMTMTEVA